MWRPGRPRRGKRAGALPVVLHIGVEKTGTSTLQRFFYENRQTLRMRGIGLTQSCGPENNRDLATYAIDDTQFEDDQLIQLGIRDSAAKRRFRKAVDARFAAEVSTLRDACDSLILTSEHFQSRLKSVEEIRTLADLLAANDLEVERVIVYLRRPADIINSLYSTALRAGSTAPPPVAPRDEHWNHICEHRQTLQRWAEVFGEAAVVPRIFDRESLVGGSIIDDFCSTVGIALRGLRIPPNQNSSLTGKGQAVLRYLNHHFPASEGGGATGRRAEIIRFVDRHFAGRAPAPSASLLTACDERFGDSDEWVRARYFPTRPTLFDQPSHSRSTDEDQAADVRAVLAAIAERWDGQWSLLDELRERDRASFEVLPQEQAEPAGVVQPIQPPRRVTAPVRARRPWMLSAFARLAEQTLGPRAVPPATRSDAQRQDSR